MRATFPPDKPSGSRGEERLPSRLTAWEMAILGLPVLALALTAALPGPLVLPAWSIVLVATAIVVAAIAWLRPAASDASHARRSDMVGSLLLAGFAATILADVPEALKSLAELEALYRPATMK